MTSFRKNVSVLALTLLFSITVLLSFAPPARAAFIIDTPDNICDVINIIKNIPVFNIIISDDPWYDQGICTFSEKVFADPQDEIFGERYTFAQLGWITNSLILHSPVGIFFKDGFIGNIIGIFNLASSGQPVDIDYAQFGPFGILAGGIGFFYDHPVASGTQYARDYLAKFSLASPVHAQGYGYSSITATQSLWSASRNAGYVLMVVFILATAFLIMFRSKVNPQTVVSLQLMIPKIVVTLLAITFSYAIAGFVIDLTYLVLSFLISVIGSQGLFTNVSDTIKFFTSMNFGNLVLLDVLVTTISAIVMFLSVAGIPFAIIFLVIQLFLIFLIFKIWWMLLKAYLLLIFYIIAAPWIILLGLFPTSGSGVGLGAWLRSIISQASVFVVVAIMFLFNIIFLRAGFGGASGILGTLITILTELLSLVMPGEFPNVSPGAISGTLPTLPLFNGSSLMVYTGITYAILALTPKAAELVRDALKVPAFKYGSAFGQALGPIFLVPQKGIGIGAGAAEFAAGQFKGTDEKTASWLASTAKTLGGLGSTLSGWQKRLGG